ncbi:MAG TPA: hypothetical protein VJ718_03735, partial [Candidatus Binataceae bacterium]|nr:hypothetical protein [Candidatus Binataceae bacterium]
MESSRLSPQSHERSHRGKSTLPQSEYKGAAVAAARRIVIKVGSAVLSDRMGLRVETIEQLAAQIDEVAHAGRQTILVTSGAIAAGRARIGGRAVSIAERQAAAAIGQIELMRRWAKAFEAHGRIVAQLLLTHQDVAERRRRLNAV